MTNTIDDTFDSLGKGRRLDYSKDQINTISNLTKDPIEPAFKNIKKLTDARKSMHADILTSKTKASDPFDNYEVRIKENNLIRLAYKVRFELTDKGQLAINRIFATEFDNLYQEGKEKTERFELNQLSDFNQKMIEEDFAKKLVMSLKK
jgi:hypothetical protein